MRRPRSVAVRGVGGVRDRRRRGRPDFDAVARYYNLILFRKCATDLDLFKDHIRYLKNGMVFPRIVNRIKTLGMYVDSDGATGKQIVFKEAMGLAYMQHAGEIVSEADTIVFDKTGTLTKGNFVVSNIMKVRGMTLLTWIPSAVLTTVLTWQLKWLQKV